MKLSRRNLLRLATGAFVPAAGFTRFGLMNALAQTTSNYKALVCIFLFGGNDSHNMVIPQQSAAYNAYKTIRGTLALPDVSAKLLPVTALNGTPYALSDGLTAIHPFWAQKKLAVVANVGMLVQPTSRTQFLGGAVPVPTNLFSHSDQVIQMQTANPGGSGGTGWGGRIADASQASNSASSYPPSISMSGPTMYCVGSSVQSASLIPGFSNTLWGMDFWPQSAADARKTAYQQILTMDSGLAVIQAANKVRQDAIALEGMMKSVASGPAITTVFPGTSLGNQLRDVAKMIQLRSVTGLQRQVFFCSLGGFDTHGSQSWQHWDLLKQLGEAMAAFYNATAELGIADQVTTFTESDFGRTLQPSGTGSDHGWGSHHIVLGGAVKGGDLYGNFPTMALGGPDDANNRGVLIPSTSLDQYGASMARWFGLDQTAINAVFPNLANFATKDLGFLV